MVFFIKTPIRRNLILMNMEDTPGAGTTVTIMEGIPSIVVTLAADIINDPNDYKEINRLRFYRQPPPNLA